MVDDEIDMSRTYLERFVREDGLMSVQKINVVRSVRLLPDRNLC
ncbi:MAG: hypothetical protein NZ805_12820 [Armatimonadetes bacterium]|nr:hypothetical protein [Armatimonadota bacterium]